MKSQLLGIVRIPGIVIACSATSDATVTSGATVTHPSGLTCPQPPLCESTSSDVLPIRMQATQLSDGVEFAAMSDRFVLATRPDANARRAFVAAPRDGEQPEQFELLPVAQLGAEVVLAIDEGEDRTLVLRCDPGLCAIATLELGSQVFEHVTTVTLKSIGEERLEGIAAARASNECPISYRWCVFGSGLHCWDGAALKPEISPQAGQRLRAVAR